MSINQEHIPEELLRKLSKLRNLAEGARAVGSLAEAENAAEKYQELLLKHNLDDQAVINHGVQEKIKMLHSQIDAGTDKWMHKLIRDIAHHCMCRTVRDMNSRDGRLFHILGESVNVAVAMYMIEQLLDKITIAYKSAWMFYKGEEKRHMFKKSFYFGAVDAIAMRIVRQEVKLQLENKEMGLMLVGKRELATTFMEQKFPELKMSKARNTRGSSLSGYEQGKAAGSRMDLDKSAANRANQKRLE